MKRNILIALFAVVSLAGWAQEKSKVNPGWLWEISGNGLAQKSYLFGTCHGDGHSFTTEEIYGCISGLSDAMNKVEAVFLEHSIDPQHQPEMKLYKADEEKGRELVKKFYNPGEENIMPEGVSYESLFDSVSHFNELKQFMTDKMHDAEYWKKTPGYWSSRLGLYLSTMGQTDVKFIDIVLAEEAQKRGKETGGLETYAFAYSKLLPLYMDVTYLDTLPMKEQVQKLYALVKMCSDYTPFKNNTFHKEYIANDTCRFSRFLEEDVDSINAIGIRPGESMSKMVEYQQQHLLLERNEAWIPNIEEYIASRPCMIAVGCRHLLGSNSLIVMLRRKGYSVTPVF